MLIRGKCHCSNISFSLTWEPDPNEIPARACTCSFCAKHGGVWTSNPKGALEVVVKEPALVSRYAFGTRTAEFHTCARCGVVPVVTSMIEGRLYAVVSVNAFENVDSSRLTRKPASFDGEGQDDRLARRQRNWIADVRFAGSSLMLTIEKLRLYNEFNGDMDGWARSARKGESAMTDDDWFLIEELRQGLLLVSRGRASSAFSASLDQRLAAVTSDELTRQALKELARLSV